MKYYKDGFYISDSFSVKKPIKIKLRNILTEYKSNSTTKASLVFYCVNPYFL